MSGRSETWAHLRTMIDQHGQPPPATHDEVGEHHWLCPEHMTAEGRELADRIGTAFGEQVQKHAEEDTFGSFGQIYDALWEDTAESGLSQEGKGRRWLELMTMSLGYWLDSLVLDAVEDQTGATTQQCHDVAVFRELLRREEALEMAHGIVVRRVERDE